MTPCRAILDLPRELSWFVAGLVRAGGVRWEPERAPDHSVVTVGGLRPGLISDETGHSNPRMSFGLSQSTSYRYLHEVIDYLHEVIDYLHQVIDVLKVAPTCTPHTTAPKPRG